MTADDIRQVLHDALRPINASVRELSGKFDQFQIGTVTALAENRTELKHVSEGVSSLTDEVKEIRQDHADCIARSNWPLVAAHMKREDDSQVFTPMRGNDRQTDKKSDPEMLKIALPKSSVRYLPWIMTSLVFGAALGGAAILGRCSGNDPQVEQAAQYLSTIQKYGKVQQEPADPPEETESGRPVYTGQGSAPETWEVSR